MGAEHSRRYHPPTAAASVNLSSVIPNTDLVRRKKSRQMDKLRRTLSFRIKKKEPLSDNTNQSKKSEGNLPSTENKPLQWQDDDKSVRVRSCNFNVKYLGSVEVYESRGMHICEQAIQTLLNQKHKHMKAVLYISADALRVVDEANKGLVVDQTIEKVSFCAPDRNHEKGFAYICRDGTTRQWVCHAFLAIKDTGERLSHAVGCAFQTCLERKQKRDRECGVTVEYTQNGSSFTRFGSFCTPAVTERITTPQSAAIMTKPISHTATASHQRNDAIERPRPTASFRKPLSLKPGDLPPIPEARHKASLAKTKEVETTSTTNELSKLSLFDSTNTKVRSRPSLPPTKPAVAPSLSITITNENITADSWLTNPQSHISEQSQQTPSINDAFNSNLSSLMQRNHAVNPFSSYGVSMATQVQSPAPNHRQSTLFSSKRGTNPFDDLIRQ